MHIQKKTCNFAAKIIHQKINIMENVQTPVKKDVCGMLAIITAVVTLLFELCFKITYTVISHLARNGELSYENIGNIYKWLNVSNSCFFFVLIILIAVFVLMSKDIKKIKTAAAIYFIGMGVTVLAFNIVNML